MDSGYNPVSKYTEVHFSHFSVKSGSFLPLVGSKIFSFLRISPMVFLEKPANGFPNSLILSGLFFVLWIQNKSCRGWV